MHYLGEHLETALLAALDAGGAILDIYSKDFNIRYKDDRSPLTLADRRSHDIIVRHLTEQQVADSLPILSEEGRDISFQERKQWVRFWLVDPLDGTKEFIKRNGEFTVNIALVEKNRPILGVIYAPDKELLFFAAKGLGAYKLKQRGLYTDLKNPTDRTGARGLLDEIISRARKLPRCFPYAKRNASPLTIVGSRSHPTKELEAFVEAMKKEHGSVAFISAGSSLKFCLVAEGKADMYPRLGPTMEWDTAAGQIIVEQAQGSVLNAETNEPLQYNKADLLNPWFIVRGKWN